MPRSNQVHPTGGAAIAGAGAIESGGPTAAAAVDPRQFVIFQVQNEMFAIPLAEVQEIIRMPSLLRMPLSPPALEGLANLRGSMLPVVNLRTVFGFPHAETDDQTRVVILDLGRPIGLVVDRMSSVVTADEQSIEPTDMIKTSVDTDMLTGMIKGRDGAAMVMILDAAMVIKREFRESAGKAAAADLASQAQFGDAQSDMGGQAVLDEVQLVSFDVAGQEYAFPIDCVQEIVQLPDLITQVPNSPSHVLGVITLRQKLLPLVSLRALFGLPGAAVTDASKVVVVTPGDDTALAVGLVMDCIREVLRVGRGAIDPMPPLLAQNRSLSEIRSICRLDHGRRMVSILSASQMFGQGDLQKLAEDAGKETMAMRTGSETGAAAASGDEEQFVVFRLMNEEYGVPIDSVQEIVRVPEALTQIPKTPAFIEGVINLRGSVLPVVDQRRRFGLASCDRNDRQRIMVFAIKGVRTGFIVDQVLQVTRIAARHIGAAPKLSAEQQKLIRRVANLEAEQRMILLLDVNQLLNVKELGALRDNE